MTITLHIIVEGQTERQFAHEILLPHLSSYGIVGIVQIITTSIQSKTYRGGVGTYTQIKQNIKRALGRKGCMVTTMLDLYGLPQDMPGRQNIPRAATGIQQVTLLESMFGEDIADRRFIPYIQLHEYETLLFSDIHAIDTIIGINGPTQVDRLQEILTTAGEPEKINDNSNTAPSKRLHHLYPSYQKNPHNLLILKKIPLSTIRSACPHFNSWLSKLENPASQTGDTHE
ncbi:MAG: DUF4276 family protein [Methanospirillaceae archaeon]|nr:DUF4276 family protein [Methanospirillaceae archaeon]